MLYFNTRLPKSYYRFFHKSRFSGG